MKKVIWVGIIGILLIGCQNNYSVSGKDIANYIKPKKEKKVSPWQPVGWQTVNELIEGKTLIAEHKIYCSEKDVALNKKCLKIAILESHKSRKTKRKLKSTIILPSKHEVRKSEWGLGEYNIATTGLDIGIDNIPVDSRRYPFRKIVSIHKDQKHLRIKNPATGEGVVITITENSQQFLKLARNKNYKNINTRGQLSLSQAITGKVITTIAKAMKEGASSSSTGSKTFTCTYSCISDVGLLYETYRNVGNMNISSNSYASAKDKANDIAQTRCRKTLDKHGYKMRGGSADCDFGQ